uniref:Uncharacterized protein n=1 Tax=Spongospora subterranea TaxID=70186 RepID=A0A0H5QZ09_9EUKA|eukprot:CRZ07217.1 hypothetical protein [Spongospora subterranea]
MMRLGFKALWCSVQGISPVSNQWLGGFSEPGHGINLSLSQPRSDCSTFSEGDYVWRMSFDIKLCLGRLVDMGFTNLAPTNYKENRFHLPQLETTSSPFN